MRVLVVLALTVTTAVAACSPATPLPRPTPTATSTSGVTAITPTPGERTVPIPQRGAYFGVHLSAGLPDREQAITSLEGDIGRPFAIDHVYYDWNRDFPSDYDRWTVTHGRILFLSLTTRMSGQPTAKWADVAAGTYDAMLTQRAVAIGALGVPILMSFDHEPGAQVGTGAQDSGSPAEYVAAWRHVVGLFDAEGVTNVSWVWTLTAFSFREGSPADFYPGDDIVDWVGADGYANIDCPWLDVPWRSWDEIFLDAETFAGGHRKPFVIAEFSAREDPAEPDKKAEWLRDAVGAVTSMPALKAVVAFNSTASCSSDIVSSTAALDAYRAVGEDPLFAPVSPTAAVAAG